MWPLCNRTADLQALLYSRIQTEEAVTREEFDELFRGVPIKIGLRQQGHIPTVERMLAHGATWDEIGKAIGWHGPTAQRWYELDQAHKVRQDCGVTDYIEGTYGIHGCSLPKGHDGNHKCYRGDCNHTWG